MSNRLKLLLIAAALLLLLAPRAVGAEPKFHFRNIVMINAGFFKGCDGYVNSVITDEESDSCDDKTGKIVTKTVYKYVVEGDCHAHDFNAAIPESYLTRD